jgi:hypothetical protein
MSCRGYGTASHFGTTVDTERFRCYREDFILSQETLYVSRFCIAGIFVHNYKLVRMFYCQFIYFICHKILMKLGYSNLHLTN